MFGLDDDKKQDDQSQIVSPPSLPTGQAGEPTADATLAMDSAATTQVSAPPLPPSLPTGQAGASTDTPAEDSAMPAVEPTKDDSNSVMPSLPEPSDISMPTVGSNDLLDIKKDALEELAPLVSHLDQTPEEKFKTTMMMIQASDNQSLVKDAYDTAKQITDEKARAQALLDIVNEINYFSQQASK